MSNKFFKCEDGTLIEPNIVSAVFKVYDNGYWYVVFCLPIGTKIRVRYNTSYLAKKDIEKFNLFTNGQSKEPDETVWYIQKGSIVPAYTGIIEVEYLTGGWDRGNVSEFCWNEEIDEMSRIYKWRKV